MRLIIRNSSIVVEGYKWGTCPRLERSFRMYDMVIHQEYYIGLYYDEEHSKLYLPRGIDIWFVENELGIKHEIDYDYDEYAETKDFMIRFMPRDDVQKTTLRFMIGEGEYSDNKYMSQLSVNLNTGKGKTYVSIATLVYERKRSIIITYSNGWLAQWKKCIMEYTNAKSSDIYQISGSPSIDMILSGKSMHSDHSVYLITHSAIKSYATAHGWDKITKLFKTLKIGFKFYDEAHLNFANMSMIDFFTNTFRTYYITATPARSSDEENRIYQLYLKNIPGISLFNKEEDPHTKYIAMMYNSMPNPYDISGMKNAYGLDINKYCNWLVYKDTFHYMFRVTIDLIMGMIKDGGKVLFFIHTNEAITIVKSWLEEEYPEFRGMIGVYSSLSDNKSAELKYRIILTTIKSAGAAVDINGLKAAVILADPFKSKVNARQILGRTRADDTYLIELVDLGFYQIKKWYYNKLPTYNKYAMETKDVFLRSNELMEKAQDIIDWREWKGNAFKYNKDHGLCVRINEEYDSSPKECVKFHKYIL